MVVSSHTTLAALPYTANTDLTKAGLYVFRIVSQWQIYIFSQRIQGMKKPG
jgi:hypothetical protein